MNFEMSRLKQKVGYPENVIWFRDLILSRYSPDRDDNAARISEWKLALLGLVLSLSVIVGKLFHVYRYDLYNLFVETRLTEYQTILTDGDVTFHYAWTSALKYSNIWFPLLCGVLTTWFTWLMVYLDSCVPGIEPPSPLSPSKYKIRSGHVFHLNYMFAVLVGLFVSVYMFLKGATLQL